MATRAPELEFFAACNKGSLKILFISISARLPAPENVSPVFLAASQSKNAVSELSSGAVNAAVCRTLRKSFPYIPLRRMIKDRGKLFFARVEPFPRPSVSFTSARAAYATAARAFS